MKEGALDVWKEKNPQSTAAASKKMENTRLHAITVWKQWTFEHLLGLEPLYITILLIFVSKLLTRFQGQWMGVGISGSFLKLFVSVKSKPALEEVLPMVCSNGTSWQCYLPTLHIPHMQIIQPSTACSLHMPLEPWAYMYNPAQALCWGGVSAANQEKKECRQRGTPNVAFPKGFTGPWKNQGNGWTLFSTLFRFLC